MKKVKLTYKKVLAVLFSLVIFAFFISVCERFVRSAVLGQDVSDKDSTSANSEEAGSNQTDWTKEFPFSEDYSNSGYEFSSEEESEASAESSEEETDGSFVSKVESIVKSAEDKVDYYTTQLLAMRMKFVELNSGFNKTIGMKLINGTDNVVILKNGYLAFKNDREDMSNAANNVVLFNKKLQKQGINFLYVQEPTKLDKYDNQMPFGIDDNENLNADDLVDALNKNSINCLDLRETMQEQGIDHYSAFFKTDHHWKPETGLWATGEIIKRINQISELNLDSSVSNTSKYDVEVYKDYCFGSQGKKVTLSYADPEDISLITPKYDTDFNVTYYSSGISYAKSGEFKSAFLNMSYLEKIDYYKFNVYATYLYGDHERITIDNNNAKNDTKILYIIDSFSECVIPYFASTVKHIDVIDLRYFNGSLESFIAQNKPDMVVMAYSPATLANDLPDGAFDFR